MNRITKLQFSTSACLLAILCCVLFLGCKPEPELYINGKPFYTRSRCVESETETIWEYHYGYNTFRGKYEFHYGPNTKTECVKSVIDTVEIKQHATTACPTIAAMRSEANKRSLQANKNKILVYADKLIWRNRNIRTKY